MSRQEAVISSLDPATLDCILNFTKVEKLELMGAICESIPELAHIPLTEAQKLDLDRRLKECERSPHEGISWEELEAKLDAMLDTNEVEADPDSAEDSSPQIVEIDQTLLAQVVELTVPEKLELIGLIEESIEAFGEPFRLTPGQEEELSRRIEDHEANPGEGITWPELKAKLKARRQPSRNS
jgi:putative addiction module component (TIGR02574 family)